MTATITQLHPNACNHLDYHQMIQATGLTPRQLDVWTRTGRIEAHRHAVNRGGRQAGPGVNRYWSANQVIRVIDLKQLMALGFTLEAAARLRGDHAELQHTIKELSEMDELVDVRNA